MKIHSRVIYSILFYILVIMLILIAKPRLVFDDQGELRHFGVGTNHTILPLGVCVVILALLSYYIFGIIDLIFMQKQQFSL